ncbi:MAG TPA: sugar phosphate isomerase/epimerase [Chryseolinea sp.]|nr:sugar phosphate isomerase/epimerase [Chryseolinea sp.]HPM30224.1 sugar phosphate isomerase/epimerase [Chryseolinea sp.]
MKNLTAKKVLLIIVLIISFSSQKSIGQEIGIQMGSMRKMFNQGMPATLARIKELGVTELEGGFGRGIDRLQFKTLLKDNGLKIIATGGSFERISNKDSIQKVIINAKELGALFVVCYWIPHDGDNFTFADMQKAVEVFNTAGKTLKENGLALCYHPHGYEFRQYEGGGKSTMFEYMMDNTNPEYINFQMDVFWIKNPGQDPAALLRNYPTRWKMLHLKDRRIGTVNNGNGRQDVESNVVLGTGDVNIAEAMKAAKEIGIKHYFIEDESSRALEQVPLSIIYLKSLK